MSSKLMVCARASALVVVVTLPALGQEAPNYELPPVADRVAVKYLQGADTEDRDLRPLTLFLEESWVLFGGPGQILETQIAPHLHPFQKPASARDRLYGGWFFKLAVTPMVRVRILRQYSAPVRTPSFMPKGTFQAFRLGSRSPGETWGKTVGLWNLQGTVGHHSNGQDGCMFEGTVAPDCLGADPDALVINRVNGSFSTNYFRLGVNYRHIWLERAGGYTTDYRAVSAGVSFETHPGWFNQFGGTLGPEVRPIYGPNRWRAYVEIKFPSKRWYIAGPEGYETRVRLWGQYVNKSKDTADCGIPGGGDIFEDPCAAKTGWGVDLFRRIGSAKRAEGAQAWVDELAIYARYHRAQDYYNLGFSHMYTTFQIGLAFDVGRAVPFRLPDLSESPHKTLLDEEKTVMEDNPDDPEGAWTTYRKENREYARKAPAIR